jgi:GT2 family glycosyltransferase
VTDVSIVIVSFDTRQLLLDCVAALRALPVHGLTIEIIVVDNGSSDGSAEALRAADPEVTLISLPRNRGFAVGANEGIARSRGEALLLLNSDAFPAEGAIEACHAALLEPGVGAVGPQLVHADGRLQNSVHAFPSLLGELLPNWLLELAWPARFPSKRRRNEAACDVDAVLGAALMVRREVALAVGPLSEDYFFYLEETDWCWRIQRAGWRVRLVPQARVMHLSGASSKRRDPARARIEYHRSLYHFLAQRRGAGTARAVRVVRFAKGGGSVVALALLAPFSRKERARLAERTRVLIWHLQGCPADAGLAGLGELETGAGSTCGAMEKGR